MSKSCITCICLLLGNDISGKKKKKVQIVITLLSKTAVPTENLVAWQTLFFPILQQTTESLHSSRVLFRYIQQTKVLFSAVQKGVNSLHFNKTFPKFSLLSCRCVCWGFNITGTKYNWEDLSHFFYFPSRTVFLPQCQFYFFHKLLQQLNPLKSGHFIAPQKMFGVCHLEEHMVKM